MKIIHLIDNLGLGGAQSFLKGIFENQRKNHNIYLYSLRSKKENILINHKNIFINKSSSKFSFNQILEIKKLIYNEKIGIIHCHLFKAFLIGIILKLFFFKDIKLIFHEHGRIIATDNNNIIEDYIYVLFLKVFKDKVDLFISVSNFIKEILINKIKINKENIITLYNYVDLNKFKRSKFDNRNNDLMIKKNKKDFFIGFAGRIVQRKGWEEYVESAKILSKNHPYMKFFIAGDGAQEKKLLKIIKKNNLENKINYLGYINDIKKYYFILDCFVLSSHWEGLPMTQLEVMAYGIPLVTCNGPGMNEIPEDNISAVYCKIKDPFDLADKIIKVHENKLLRKKLISNSKKIVKKYSLDKFLLNLNESYEDLLND